MTFNKTYTATEEPARLAAFVDNLKRIDERNAHDEAEHPLPGRAAAIEGQEPDPDRCPHSATGDETGGTRVHSRRTRRDELHEDEHDHPGRDRPPHLARQWVAGNPGFETGLVPQVEPEHQDAQSPAHDNVAGEMHSEHDAAQPDLAGAIWLEGSPTVEETTYWLNLLIDTQLPITTCASQRTHGQLANDGDRNIVDAVDVILSGHSAGMGVVGVQDERIYAAREFKKADDRPGNYKATGGHGGILGTVGPPVTIWYRPTYKHTATSDVNLTRLPPEVTFNDTIGDSRLVSVRIKDSGGGLLATAIPRVNIVKHASYMGEDDSNDPDQEVDILARIAKALSDQSNPDGNSPELHGLVLEGTSPYGLGSTSQMAALAIAVYSGLPVVRVGRSDPGGRVPGFMHDLSIAGSNLDANKARLLLMASMLKLGRFPKAKNPRNPTSKEKSALQAKIAEFQEIFESH